MALMAIGTYINIAHADTLLYPACADCYRCTLGTESSCRGTCVYDKNYCQTLIACPEGYIWSDTQQKCIPGSIVGPCLDKGCLSPKVLNTTTCECECPDRNDVACLAGSTYNEDTCECEKQTCETGFYMGKFGCTACPEYADFVGNMTPVCSIYSSNSGSNGISDCYKKAIQSLSITDGVSYCKYSDETGSYEFSSDCHYTEDFNSGEIIGGIEHL